jgi:hypothetical protein
MCQSQAARREPRDSALLAPASSTNCEMSSQNDRFVGRRRARRIGLLDHCGILMRNLTYLLTPLLISAKPTDCQRIRPFALAKPISKKDFL